MEVFELSSDAVSWPHPSDIAVDPRLFLLLMGMGPAHCGTFINTLSIQSKFYPKYRKRRFLSTGAYRDNSDKMGA